MASAVLTVADKSLGLDDKCIAFYIDNNAARCGLIKADSKTTILAILPRISWEIVAHRGITHWVGRVGSDMNMSDFTTRLVEMPYHIVPGCGFRSETAHLDIITRAFCENRWGFRPTGRIRIYF